MKAKEVIIQHVDNGFILKFDSYHDSFLKTEYEPGRTEVFAKASEVFERISQLFKDD